MVEGARGEFAAHWRVLLAALVGVTFGIASMFLYSQGLFIKALVAEFGWSRTDISLSFLAGSIACALVSPLAGALADRFGARAVGCGGLLALGLYFLLLGRSDGAIGWFVAVNIVLGALAAGSSPVIFSRLVASHFVRRRGLALGIALCGTGITGALLPLALGAIIADFGWRQGYVAMALAIAAVIPAIWFLAREEGAAGEGTAKGKGGQ